MIKKYCLLLLLFSSAVGSWCDNIYVYIEKGLIDVDEDENRFSTDLLNVMEDGILESFFEKGHIVFAANSSKTTFNNDRILNQAAKRGGADKLLKAVINYTEKNNIVEISGNYKFYNLYSDSLVAEGDYSLPENFNMSGLRIEELFFSVGRSFAERISGSI